MAETLSMARDTSEMSESAPVNLWSSAAHALDYLSRADSIPHRTEGEATLLEFVPLDTRAVLDLGCGNGRLTRLVKIDRPSAVFTALDFSPAMIESLRSESGGDPRVRIIEHDLDRPLPALGTFDAAISSFAIHHLVHERKKSLYAEVFEILRPGGVFCNLEHVSSATARLHEEFLRVLGVTEEDPSNKLLDLETQLGWLREIGFEDVDCHWKWRELALFVGRKPIHK